MELLFYIVPSLIIAMMLFWAFAAVRRTVGLQRAWHSGLTANARCLNVFTKTSGGQGNTSVHTTVHHVYEFTTRDGRVVRFEERGGPATRLEGDVVTVYYTEDSKVFATAEEPGHVSNVAGLVALLVFIAVIICFCVGVMGYVPMGNL
ncbi:DUF3592 domain-containing protein [Nocardia sp. NPDC049526]|uniref:DUF3592 domain-containing protein n=1 Tax=Nocardia sp. NPDC049526 TaxID=3364316 RepID=UPI0037A3C1DC